MSRDYFTDNLGIMNIGLIVTRLKITSKRVIITLYLR